MSVPISFLTVEEYLKAEETSQIRYEYLGGQVFAMAGGSKEHNLITLNVASRLRSHLRGSSCNTFMSDMKVRIELAQEKSIYYYPDVIVSCDSDDQDRFFLNYPCLIIEVLSPSTEVTDKREKLFNYQNLSSLQEYVLIYQNEIKVEVYRKDNRGNWYLQTYGKNDELNLDSVNLTMTMTEIYEDVFNI